MKKIFAIFTLLLFTASMHAQEKFSVVLKGQIFSTESDTLYLYQNKGQGNTVAAHIPIDGEGVFEKSVELEDRDYYVLSLEDNQGLNLIIDDTDTIKVYGDGRSLFYNSNISGADGSSEMLEFLRIAAQYQSKLDSANRYLKANKDKQAQIQREFQNVYETFNRQRDQYIRNQSNSPALIAAISYVNFEQEFELYDDLINKLKKSFGESPTIKNLVIEYEKNKAQMIANKPLSPGSEVKEIALPNPEGDTLRLSDYKGKVVLIDFWAAWCGPCRRENPNVVKLYNQYHDEGFEVFSVSLDKTKDKWMQAIKQDGLIWEAHVSDLKGWRSAAGQDYNVSSIPFTVLIDREGKVIGTNLRGEALGQKLKSIFE